MVKPVPGPEPSAKQGLETLQPRCEWRLRELMAVRKHWYTTTKLVPELRKHGFEFDRSYVYRLVKAESPPNVPIGLIVALCKIFDCRFEDLVVEIEPEPEPEVAPAGPRPVLPEGPLLSPEFFDAES